MPSIDPDKRQREKPLADSIKTPRRELNHNEKVEDEITIAKSIFDEIIEATENEGLDVTEPTAQDRRLASLN